MIETTTAAPTAPRRWMSVTEFSAYLGIKEKTAYQWRLRGHGPRGISIGKFVRYDLTDVDAWLDALKDGDK